MPYLLVFIRRRKALALHVILIVLVAWAYAFFIVKKEYKAEIAFLPPVGENSFSSILQSVSLESATSSDIMPEQIETIFSSKALKRRFIEEFNLYNHFKMWKNANKFENTVRALNKNLTLKSELKAGLGSSKIISFSLCAFYTSPDTAYLMTNYAFELLDSAVKAISVDHARRNRIFVQNQLDISKHILDSLQKKMQEFQISNKAYDIPEQVSMAIRSYASLKAAILANQIHMNTLKNDYSTETPELVDLEKSNQAYQAQLSQLETRVNPDAMPSLSRSTKLLPEYENLFRDIEVQNQVILFITRELESTKMKEAKNVSSLIVTDRPYVPEYKARPKRLTIMATIIAAYVSFILLLILFQEIYRNNLRNSHVIRLIKESLKK